MYMSSQEEVQKALRGLLIRDGVQVGGGSGYPRVEIHSWNEQAPSDKGVSLREATCVVESMSTASKGDALRMNGENLSRLAGQEPVTEHFRVIGIVPEALTDMEETLDTQAILYRQIQTIRLFIIKIN